MKKIKLHDLHKSEIAKQEQNMLRGGACGCVCVGYACGCYCVGDNDFEVAYAANNSSKAPTDSSANTNGMNVKIK